MHSKKRLFEIQRWLHKKVSLAHAELHFSELDEAWKEVTGESGGWLSYFQSEIVAQMQKNDELWIYDSGPISWEKLRGERGIALVRDGNVIELMMEKMN